MDDATRRHWEQIADDTIDRAIAAAIADLEAPADIGALLIRWVQNGETGAIGQGVSAFGQRGPAQNT
jgi:hypothetical protein